MKIGLLMLLIGFALGVGACKLIVPQTPEPPKTSIELRYQLEKLTKKLGMSEKHADQAKDEELVKYISQNLQLKDYSPKNVLSDEELRQIKLALDFPRGEKYFSIIKKYNSYIKNKCIPKKER